MNRYLKTHWKVNVEPKKIEIGKIGDVYEAATIQKGIELLKQEQKLETMNLLMQPIIQELNAIAGKKETAYFAHLLLLDLLGSYGLNPTYEVHIDKNYLFQIQRMLKESYGKNWKLYWNSELLACFQTMANLLNGLMLSKKAKVKTKD